MVTINRSDVVAHIEALAARLTGGNKTEVVALALRNLDERDARVGSLFGAHKGSVTIREGVGPHDTDPGGRDRRRARNAVVMESLLPDTHVIL